MDFKNSKKQDGWTMTGLLLSLILVVFAAYIAMQLVPVYTNNSNLKSAIEVAFNNSGSVRTMSRSTFIRSLRKQLYLDGKDESIDYKNDISFKRDNKGVTVGIIYDKKVHLFHNLHLLVDFNETVTRKF